jgi:hypothetical protein
MRQVDKKISILKTLKFFSYGLPIIWLVAGGLIINPITDLFKIHSLTYNRFAKEIMLWSIFLIPFFSTFWIIGFLSKKTKEKELEKFEQLSKSHKPKDKEWTGSFTKKFMATYFNKDS